MTIDDIRRAATPACLEFGVRRLDVFGSLARGNHSEASDVDLLVEFLSPARRPAGRFFGLLHRLEDALGRDIDLLTINGLKNPFFRKRVLDERIPLYER